MCRGMLYLTAIIIHAMYPTQVLIPAYMITYSRTLSTIPLTSLCCLSALPTPRIPTATDRRVPASLAAGRSASAAVNRSAAVLLALLLLLETTPGQG